MKRPEGFDRRPQEEPAQPASSARTQKPRKAAKETATAPATRQPTRGSRPAAADPATAGGAENDSTRESFQKAKRRPAFGRAASGTVSPSTQPSVAVPDESPAPTARDVRKAAAARRRYERSEVKRFTRRSRRRRITWLVVLLSFVVVGGLVTGAVYSPVLALKTITVTGTSRVAKADVVKAVDGQLGTPLALIDFGQIKRNLAKFPLIRSYVTESVPPDTLLIRISERVPIATIETASGFDVVDPAGVVIKKSDKRPAGLPLISLTTANTSTTAFTAAVQVLLALPTDLLPKVDTVTAQSLDNVTLALTSGPTVVWGSSDESAKKARILAILIANEPQATRFDVSAPTIPTFAN